jgi:hypothetical protein
MFYLALLLRTNKKPFRFPTLDLLWNEHPTTKNQPSQFTVKPKPPVFLSYLDSYNFNRDEILLVNFQQHIYEKCTPFIQARDSLSASVCVTCTRPHNTIISSKTQVTNVSTSPLKHLLAQHLPRQTHPTAYTREMFKPKSKYRHTDLCFPSQCFYLATKI